MATLLHAVRRVVRGNTVCLLPGGNIDVRTFARVVGRSLVVAECYLKLRVELNDAPELRGNWRIYRVSALPIFITSVMTDTGPVCRWAGRSAYGA